MKTDYFGVGCLNSIRSIMERHKATRIFLVTGGKSFFVSGAQAAITPYLDGKIVVRFSDFSVNPKIGDVIKGVSELRQAKSDIVIAIGGGSAIDMAKLINITFPSIYEPHDIVTGKKSIDMRGLPLIAIPTTAGSGSEATHFAVVYVDSTKYSLAHKYILPDYSIVDPSLTYGLPPGLTAVSGFDALCQAVESYWAITATEESQEYASQSIRMILSSLESAVNSPNREARKTMSLAAHLAGKAINITKTTAPHAISYPLTTCFNIPHGHAAALMLGKFFVINSRTEGVKWNDPRGTQYVQNIMHELYGLFDCADARECSEKWYKLMAAAGLETRLEPLGICHQSDIDLIIKNVNAERLDNNPIIIDKSILEQLFQQV